MRHHAKIYIFHYEYIDPGPEDPRRIYSIYKFLTENASINHTNFTGITNIGNIMTEIPIREVTTEEILEVYTNEHADFLEKVQFLNENKLLSDNEHGESVYINNNSYFSATFSCGGAIEPYKVVVEGKVKNHSKELS